MANKQNNNIQPCYGTIQVENTITFSSSGVPLSEEGRTVGKLIEYVADDNNGSVTLQCSGVSATDFQNTTNKITTNYQELTEAYSELKNKVDILDDEFTSLSIYLQQLNIGQGVIDNA